MEIKKKFGVSILMSGKIDFEIKTVIRDKEGYKIIIKGSFQEEDIYIITVNIHALNIEIPQYIRQIYCCC